MPADDTTELLLDLLQGLRSSSQAALDSFARSAASGDGGELVIQAPCTWQKRPRVEIRYRSEGWQEHVIMRIPRQG